MTLPAIEPMPPLAAVGMPWHVETADPVAALAAARRELGDTFVVDSGGDRHLFLFSPAGVRAFYGLDEAMASKGVADWRMLKRKVPPELFDGRRTLPHDLFNRTDAEVQLRSLATALDRMVVALVPGEVIDVFDWSRRLGHLVGLTSWGGIELLDDSGLDDLLSALDALDASDAFVHPERMREIAANDHAAERAALATAATILGRVIERRRTLATAVGDLLDRVIDSWSGDPTDRAIHGAALDVVLVHLSSMSNLFAAMGWAVLDVAVRPDLVAAVRDRRPGVATACALESIRCAQRSVMLRHVLAPVEIPLEGSTHRVSAGVTVATLLPLTNSSAAPGLDGFDPGRWEGRRLGPHDGLAARELVTTFGHGSHACPAQAFSLRAITATVEALVDRFDLTPLAPDPRPVPGQIGGVARAAGPTPLRCDARA